MQSEQAALLSFVRLHGSRLKKVRSDERVAHLVNFSEAGVPLDSPLKQFTVQDILSELDSESMPVRWLIRQVQTYDVDGQNVIGLIFNRQSVLAHVVQCGSAKTEADVEDDI